MWFNDLTGFQEETPEQVRKNLTVSSNTLNSKINGKSYIFGKLETPTLADLRERIKNCKVPKGQLTLTETVGDVQKLHTHPSNEGAMFQAASQFNLLEMVSPSVLPEAGIGIYEHDRTQGPACAIAVGAGTIYRNYLVEVNNQIGQSKTNQIDCLKDIGKALGNEHNRLWVMQNGYALASKEGLEEISQHLQSLNKIELDELRANLRIGLQWNTQVTLHNCQHLVSQAYCSALPVAYSQHSPQLWADFAHLILEATYEATLAAATLNFEQTNNPTVFLTLVGGGVFGNPNAWIFAAMKRALQLYSDVPLDIRIVSYGRSNDKVIDFIEGNDSFSYMIYHISTPTTWKAQAASDVYEAPSLHKEGFIHCSKAEQIEGVIDRYFESVPNLLILRIDPTLLNAELKYEESTGGELYPHIYGSINKSAIVDIREA